MGFQVELAHGGRVSSSSSSYDRYNSYSSGGSRGGVSRRSDYRGEHCDLRFVSVFIVYLDVAITTSLCSLGHWSAIICLVAGFEGEDFSKLRTLMVFRGRQVTARARVFCS